MGTWNATCAVTQLPIEEGKRTVMIPLILMPQDPLSRDNISGGGSCDNDVIARPLSIPIRGVYDGVGGVAPNKRSVGLACLKAALSGLVAVKSLHQLVSSEPILCKTLPHNFMELLTQGYLVVMGANTRKAWLERLHEAYNKSDNKAGMSHYKAQLKVDPTTLPEFVMMPLALNMVSPTLYDALAKDVGLGDSIDHWNEETNKAEHYKGNRVHQLLDDLTLSEESRQSIQTVVSDYYKERKVVHAPVKSYLDRSKRDPSTIDFGRILEQMLLRKARPNCMKLDYDFMYAPIDDVLKEIVLNDNAALREEFIVFKLFSSAMNLMRKQWVPQTGAGSSHGLNDPDVRRLYRLTGQFIASSCDLSEAEDLED